MSGFVLCVLLLVASASPSLGECKPGTMPGADDESPSMIDPDSLTIL